jgi:large subunit ribosomal protein L5
MARIREKYQNEVVPSLQAELGIGNKMAVPRLEKIVISMGLGKAIANKELMDAAAVELGLIAGQRPIVCKARKSVSNFKLRAGMDIGVKVTLRADRMYEFFDRLVSIALPRVRDFRGVSANGFDGRGNYNFGISEQTVFPEIPVDKVKAQLGMNITVVTTAKNDQQAHLLLTKLGMPFRSK